MYIFWKFFLGILRLQLLYIKKSLEMLWNNSTWEILKKYFRFTIKTILIPSYLEIVRNQKKSWWSRWAKKWRCYTCNVTAVYGLLKIPKISSLLRRIIDYTRSCFYKLSSFCFTNFTETINGRIYWKIKTCCQFLNDFENLHFLLKCVVCSGML